MSSTHRVVLPLAGIAAALSMVTISLAAETTPITPAALPAACQLHDDASTTKTPTTTVTATATATSTTAAATTTTATQTPKVASDDDDENSADVDVEMQGDHGEAVRACIEALRAEGHHGFGEIVRVIAQAHAERNGHERDDDDSATSTTTTTTTTATTTATVTGTPTPTTTAEPHGRHTLPPTHHRD